ncbi:MAG: sulfotransferase [Phycisphaerales bacterium]|nr:sulfotransferase [Phycisphaerales bacterium]
MRTATTIFPPPPFAERLERAVTAPIKKDAAPAPGLADETMRLLSQSAGGAEVRALCINLDRRPERWEAFQRNCPIRGVHRFPAINGRAVRPPTWWRQGGGAWGCMLSHIRILEHALTDELDRRGGILLVLEDDALFPPDFAERAARFIRALPDDWEQAYLGGQHRGLRVRQPHRVNDEVVRPFMVNRTQAYAVRGPFIRVLYQHLCDWPAHARSPRHHVDHRMELLHASGRHKVYAPATWIVGQAGGPSDISGRVTQDRFWNGWGKGARQVHRPPVWVIGLHRSGSSVTAGILHRLGVHMGNRLIGYENRGGRGTGGFEAHGLAMICEQAYPFPSIERAVPVETTRRRLREWIDARQREAAWRGTIMGGKYPHLCFMIDLLLELEPESRFIHIDRPIEESIRSLVDRSAQARGWLRAKPEQCERLQRALHHSKAEQFAHVPHAQLLTVRYEDLVRGATHEVERVASWLRLGSRAEQRRFAVQIVNARTPATQRRENDESAQTPATSLDNLNHDRPPSTIG